MSKIDSGLMIRSFWIGVFLFVAIGAAHGATWIVDDDGGPGVDFTDIPSAVTAASAGDTILVRTGLYSAFTIDKGITVIAETGHHPDLDEEMATISGIPQGDTALLAGFDMKNLYIYTNQGIVVIDDCRIGEAGDIPALRIQDCRLVAFYRSSAISRDMGPDGGPSGGGGPYTKGGVFSDSEVILSNAFIKGGDGNCMYKAGGTDGEEGLVAVGCSIYAHATEVEGGRGGDAYDPFEFDGDGGDGAPGFSLQDCVLELYGTEDHFIRGGYGGSPGFMGDYGEAASPIQADHSTIRYSGVTFYHASGVPIVDGTENSVIETNPAIPVITTFGSAQLGTFIEFRVHAPEGTDYLLFVSPFADVNKVGLLMPHLLLDPLWLFPFAGGTVPAGDLDCLYIPIPHLPEFQGRYLQVQGYMQIHSVIPPCLSTSAGFVIR